MSSRSNKSQQTAPRAGNLTPVHVEKVIPPGTPSDIEVDPEVVTYLVTTLGETCPTSVRTWRMNPSTLRVVIHGSEVAGLMLVPVS